MSILVESVRHFTVTDRYNVRIWVQENNDAELDSQLMNLSGDIAEIQHCAFNFKNLDKLMVARLIMKVIAAVNAVEVLEFGEEINGVVLYRDWP